MMSSVDDKIILWGLSSYVKVRASKIPPYLCTFNFHFSTRFHKMCQLYYTTATYHHPDRHLFGCISGQSVQQKGLANKMLSMALPLHVPDEVLQQHPPPLWKPHNKTPLFSFSGCTVCTQRNFLGWKGSSAPLEVVFVCQETASQIHLHWAQEHCHQIMVSVKENWQCSLCEHWNSQHPTYVSKEQNFRIIWMNANPSSH